MNPVIQGGWLSHWDFFLQKHQTSNPLQRWVLQTWKWKPKCRSIRRSVPRANDIVQWSTYPVPKLGTATLGWYKNRVFDPSPNDQKGYHRFEGTLTQVTWYTVHFSKVFSPMVLWRTTILDNTHILSTQESSYNLEQPVSRWSKLYFHSSMERNLWTLFMIPVFWTFFFSKLLRSPGVRPGKQWGCPSALSPTWKKTTLPNWLRDDPGD